MKKGEILYLETNGLGGIMHRIEEQDADDVISRIPYNCFAGKRILMTGANGFIASSLIKVLLRLNERRLQEPCYIVALCRSKDKAKECFKEWIQNEYFELMIQDVKEPLVIDGNIHFIFHAASSSTTSYFMNHPVEVYQANIQGTINTLELAHKKNVHGYLFLSSGAVYGTNTLEKTQLSENDYTFIEYTDSKNCYCVAKRVGEALVAAYAKEYGINAFSGRVTHTYGPGIKMDDGHVYSEFVRKIISRENLFVKSPNVCLPFCYISDMLVALFIIITKGCKGEIYNIANNQQVYSIYKLAQTLCNDVFSERKIEVECDEIVYEMPHYSFLQTTKLDLLGWQPKIDVCTGFKRTVSFFEQEDEVTESYID